MKKINYAIIFAFLTLLIAPTVSAQREASASPRVQRENVMERLPDEEADETENTTTQDRFATTEEDREARREAFQTKLEEMKDIRKQAMIERVDEKINNFNERHTTKLQTGIERMQSVLDGIATKAAELNDSDLDESIESAQEAIDTAEELVTAQLEKEYFIDLEDETQIRTAAQETFTLFRTDLKEVHEAVKEAHMAVVEAARLLPKTTISEDEETDSTSEAEVMEREEESDEAL